MYPKAIRFYLIDPEFFDSNSHESIERKLATRPFQPPEPMQHESFGWVPAFDGSEILCEPVSGVWFMCGQTREKIIPPAAVNEIVAERAEVIEQAKGRALSRKERMEIKETVIHENLPTALTKTSRLIVWIDYMRGVMAVCTPSERKADEVTAYLREALGSLPAVPAHGYVHHDLTNWWLEPEDRPDDLMFDHDFSLHLPGDTTVKSTFKNHDSGSAEMKLCIDSGMVIDKAKVDFCEQATFYIDEAMTMSRIKYSDNMVCQAYEDEDPRADAIIMLGVINAFVDALGFENDKLL